MAGLEFIDIQQFRGGINTNSDDAPLQTAEELINLIPQPDGSLVSRPPMGVASGLSLPDFPADAGKFFQSVSFDDRIFIFTQRGIYFAKDGRWEYVTPLSTSRSDEIKAKFEPITPNIFYYSYFPFALLGNDRDIVSVNDPIIFDSHILFTVEFKFDDETGLNDAPPMKMSFALFKIASDQYSVRPSIHTYLNDLTSVLSASNTLLKPSQLPPKKRLFVIVEHSYTYIDIATKSEKVKQVSSKPLEFDYFFYGPSSPLVSLEIQPWTYLKRFGLNGYTKLCLAWYAVMATLHPNYRLYFGIVPTDQNLQPISLSIGRSPISGQPSKEINFSFDTLPIEEVIRFIEDSSFTVYGLFKSDIDAIISSTEDDYNLTYDLPASRFGNETVMPKLPKSFIDYSNVGFFIRDFGTRYITTQDYLFLTSGAFLYYSVNGAYDFFDPLKRITLDSQFCDIQSIQQVSVIFTEKSLSRVEGEIGGGIPFLIRIFDIGIPIGSKTYQFNDRVFFSGTDGRLYAANRFNADAAFGLPVQGLADDLADKQYKPIELPEYNAFGLVFENSFVICYRWDIGAFFSFLLPLYANSTNLFTVGNQYLFLGPDLDRVVYYQIGGTGRTSVKDISRFSYRSPIIYPALQAERQSGQVTENDLVSIQSIDVTEKKEGSFFCSLRSDTTDQPIVIRYTTPEPRGRRAVGMMRSRELRIAISGSLESSVNIRRIRVYFMRHTNSGYSSNEYR